MNVELMVGERVPQVRSTKHFCVDVVLVCILLSIGVFIFKMYKK